MSDRVLVIFVVARELEQSVQRHQLVRDVPEHENQSASFLGKCSQLGPRKRVGSQSNRVLGHLSLILSSRVVSARASAENGTSLQRIITSSRPQSMRFCTTGTSSVGATL